MPLSEPEEITVQINDDDLASIYGPGSFVIAPGNRSRAMRCLICQEPIGGHKAIITGIAAFHPSDCDCGGIAVDAWLAHAAHWPLTAEDLQAAIHRGLAPSHS